MSRARAVVLVAGLAAMLGALALPTWVTGTVRTALTDATTLSVPGGSAAPAVGAGALVVAAGGLALALARRVGCLVAVGAVGAGGGLAGAAGLAVLVDPEQALTAAALATVGTADLSGAAGTSAAPVVTVALGVITIATAVWVGRASRAWVAPSRRHERNLVDPAWDDRSLWDSMSRGDDPTADRPNG